MAAVFHGYDCKFLQQKTNGMTKQPNKTQWVCPKMGPKIHRNHHNYVIFPLHFLKKVFHILRHARVFCTETLPNFLHHEGAGLHHLVAMCSMCVHATKKRNASMASTCATPCNAMLHCFHSKYFLRSVEICVQHWIFVVCIEKH